MSTATIELSSTRKKLFELLGDSQTAYIEHMKNWFRKKNSKEEFDAAARKLLSPDAVHLHNQFLLAILNKCQTLVNMTPGSTIKSDKLWHSNQDPAGEVTRLKIGKVKRKANLEHKFQPMPVSNSLPDVTKYNVTPEERRLQFCQREKTMPDISLVHGRLLVAAWEEGLEGVEDQAVALTLAAAEQQMRRLISCLVTSRNSWRERGGLRHSVGTGAPDPWLINTQQARRGTAGGGGGATQPTLHNTLGLAPADREEATVVEREGLYQTALATPPRHSRPLDLFNLLAALQSDRAAIPSHQIYSMSIERIIMRLHHET